MSQAPPETPAASSSAPLERAASGGTPPRTSAGAGIDYRLFLDCVHCGLCTASCPTYLETGNENDSPRGRIYLMRGVTDGRLPLDAEVRRHLELCLDCRGCETACPSGVQYGRLIEPFRVAMDAAVNRAASGAPSSGPGALSSPAAGEAASSGGPDWFHRWILFALFPYPERLRWALAPARLAQRLGLDRLARGAGLFELLSPRLRQLIETTPPLGPSLPPLPPTLPAIGPRRARVALFLGCVADVMFRQTHWATARVLQRNGCEVVVPRGQGCCGAIHYHAGSSEPARALADANIAAFSAEDVDAVVVNVAGCGAMLKDYGHDWNDARQPVRAAWAAKVRDVHQFLDDLGLTPPTRPVPLVATYHDACHLVHAQKIREAPRRLLAQIPGLELRELTESDLCCGAAGTYNLTQPEMAQRLSRRKLENILRTGAEVVVAANAGCLLQISREARAQGRALRIIHPMELLAESYGDAG